MKIHGLRFVERQVPAPEYGEGFSKLVRILQMQVPPDEESEKYGGYHPIWIDVPLVQESPDDAR